MPKNIATDAIDAQARSRKHPAQYFRVPNLTQIEALVANQRVIVEAYGHRLTIQVLDPDTDGLATDPAAPFDVYLSGALVTEIAPDDPSGLRIASRVYFQRRHIFQILPEDQP